MTQLEYIEAMAALEQEAREQKRHNAVQLELIEAKHRDNINNENDRYVIEKRRQKAEYAERHDTLQRRITEVKRQRAITRAEEEKERVNSFFIFSRGAGKETNPHPPIRSRSRLPQQTKIINQQKPNSNDKKSII